MSITIKTIIAGMLLSPKTVVLHFDVKKELDIEFSPSKEKFFKESTRKVRTGVLVFYTDGDTLVSVGICNPSLSINQIADDLNLTYTGPNPYSKLKGDCKTFLHAMVKAVGDNFFYTSKVLEATNLQHKCAIRNLTKPTTTTIVLDGAGKVFITDLTYMYRLENKKVITHLA